MEAKETFDVQESQVDFKRTYETPLLVESNEMNFAKEIWQEFCSGNWCFGCTNCSCR